MGMLPEIVWESYHSDGSLRRRPLPSTVHGWLTKMRGTIMDNETIRREGIREMRQAADVRAKKRADPKPSKSPLLRLSFLRHRPKLVARSSGRPVRDRRHSTHMRKRKQPSGSSRPRNSKSSSKKAPGRSHHSKKSNHASKNVPRRPRRS